MVVCFLNLTFVPQMDLLYKLSNKAHGNNYKHIKRETISSKIICLAITSVETRFLAVFKLETLFSHHFLSPATKIKVGKELLFSPMFLKITENHL